MFESMNGRVAVVTGGSSGIGKSIVLQLAKYNVNVAVIYNKTKVDEDELIKQLPSNHGKIKAYALDINNQIAMSDIVKEIENDLGTIHYLVNCAGVIDDAFMMFMGHEQWERVIDTDLTGTFNITQAVLPCLLASNNGAIVNISSIAGLTGVAGQTNYCAAKAGLIGMTKALAKELGKMNVRVNAIAPGYINTQMISKVLKKKKDLTKEIPLARIGEVNEIASVVLFLLSDGASYITGTVITVDGGLIS